MLDRARTELEVAEAPEPASGFLDIATLKDLDQHPDPFLKSRLAFRGVDADTVQDPRMAPSETDHDSPFSQNIGGGNLTGQDDRMMDGYAKDPGEESNPPRPLRSRYIKP